MSMVTIETISPTHHVVKQHDRGETQVMAEVYTSYEYARLVRYAPSLLGAAFKALAAFSIEGEARPDPKESMEELKDVLCLIIDKPITEDDAVNMIKAADEASSEQE